MLEYDLFKSDPLGTTFNMIDPSGPLLIFFTVKLTTGMLEYPNMVYLKVVHWEPLLIFLSPVDHFQYFSLTNSGNRGLAIRVNLGISVVY